MTDPVPAKRGSVLAAFALGAAGAGVILVVLLYGLVWRQQEADVATVARYLALPFAAAFFWSGVVRVILPRVPVGVASAGYAAVWAVLGLASLVPSLGSRYMPFLFVAFVCLLLGRLGERAARWVFPERFGP